MQAEVRNFGSYKHLKFDFSKQGLSLVQGPTGSGKSTLCDIIPWVVFGKTAKGGPVDEVLSWPGNEVTTGTIWLENVIITRTRGPKSKDNDLYFCPTNGQVTRGKDLSDTQKRINEFLGIDYELYLAGAYYHEFSPTAGFFTAPAKARRVMCEQLVDLSLAVKLQERLTSAKKATNSLVDKLTRDIQTLESNIDLLTYTYTAEMVKHNAWDEDKRKRLKILSEKYDKFEHEQLAELSHLESMSLQWSNRKHAKLSTIEREMLAMENSTSTCPTCGKPADSDEHKEKALTKLADEHRRVSSEVSPYLSQISAVETRSNSYNEQIEDLKKQVNPHKATATELAIKRANKETELTKIMHESVTMKQDLANYETLEDINSYYRSITIENTIKGIETNTNELLTDHYDAEIRIVFSASSADKIEVEITKDGNTCSFTQLSKGQRQLLKLCFGISVMRAVANRHGVKFHQLFLDEAVDGLDESLKIKTYNLLKTLSLEYDSIFVVEHSAELKAVFEKSFVVTINNGESTIETI